MYARQRLNVLFFILISQSSQKQFKLWSVNVVSSCFMTSLNPIKRMSNPTAII